MKIIPYHKLATPVHEGYRGWDGGNPNFDVVSELDRDVFIVYVAWGDGELLKHDMENCRKLGRTIFHVTGDWAYVPKEPDSCFYFVTNLNPMSPCYQMQVPYSYHQSLEWLKAGNKANKGERKWLASFQGSMNTNQDRRRLTGIACDDIFINELDGWQEAQAGRAEEALKSLHFARLDMDHPAFGQLKRCSAVAFLFYLVMRHVIFPRTRQDFAPTVVGLIICRRWSIPCVRLPLMKVSLRRYASTWHFMFRTGC